MKENVSKFFNLASKFVQSDWFIALNALLIFLGWVLNVWVPMLCVAIVINVIPLFFDKETKHLITILSMFGFIMSTSRNDLKPYIPLLSLILVLLAGMIFSVTRYKRDFSLLHPAKIRGFHATLIALIVPMALAGLGSPYEDPLLVVAVFALIAVLAAVYSFFVITNDGEQKKQLPEYMLKVLFASGVVVLLEMIDAEELAPVLFAMQGTVGGSIEQVKEIFITIFLFAHGYASIIANNALEYDEGLIKSHLKRAYRGAILAVQEEMK